MGTPGGTFGDSYRPWTLAGVGELFQPPVDHNFYPRMPDNPDWVMPIIFAQRRTPDERGIYRVGGEVELVTVSESGITRETIHRWKRDKLGRKLKPFGWRERLTGQEIF